MSSRRPVAISLTKESGRKRKHEDHSSESDTGSSKSARSDRKMPRDQKKSSDSGRRGWTGPPEKDPTLHKRICAYLTENKDKVNIRIVPHAALPLSGAIFHTVCSTFTLQD